MIERSPHSRKPGHSIRGGAQRTPALHRVFGGVLLAALLVALAACSASGGGLNLSVGLAGSTADHPVQPPTIAANGPSGTYAFVYANQIWLRQDGQAPVQLTHMVLSNGGIINWGPLVWSPGGTYIAFAIAQDMNPAPGAAAPTTGPLYYVKVTDPNHPVSISPGTGSIYGHTYTWFGDDQLLYSNGSGIQDYDLGDSDPRVYPVVAVGSGSQNGSGIVTYGDISYLGGTLFYTELDISDPGQVGIVGSAELDSANIGTPDSTGIPQQVQHSWSISQVYDLGNVYAGTDGGFIAGAWRLRGSTLATQHISGVDTKAGKVSSRFCVQQDGNDNFGNACATQILQGANTLPAAHVQLAVSNDGHVALTAADALYIQDTNGSFTLAGWPTPPAWAPDNSALAVTAITHQTTDASGIVHTTTNIVLFHVGQQPGQQGTTLIAGAQDLAWQP